MPTYTQMKNNAAPPRNSTQDLWKPLYQESRYKIDLHKAIFGWLPLSIQDRLGMLRRYRLRGRQGKGTPIVAMVDGSTWHGGLTDRWKGIVSLYAFSKATGRPFKLHYVFPFAITDYQVPAQYDWIIAPEELSQNFFSTHMIRMIGDSSIVRLQGLPENKQIHVYANRDCIELINLSYKTNYTWSGLFNELFRPSPRLQNELDAFTHFTQDSYIALAFRMQNLLGDFPEYAYRATDEKRQKEIIDLCINCLEQLHKKHGTRILVTSDSNRMTEIALSLPYVFTNHGKAVHADTINTTDEDLYLKSFVDFYLLSGAEKVYAAATPEMYNSDFPKYAALIGNAPFERISLL